MAKQDIFSVSATNVKFSEGRFIKLQDGTEAPKLEWITFTDKATGKVIKLEGVIMSQGIFNALYEFREVEVEIVYYTNAKEKISYVAGVKTQDLNGETESYEMNEYGNLTADNLDDFKGNRISTYFLLLASVMLTIYMIGNFSGILTNSSIIMTIVLTVASLGKVSAIGNTRSIFNRLNAKLVKLGYVTAK